MSLPSPRGARGRLQRPTTTLGRHDLCALPPHLIIGMTDSARHCIISSGYGRSLGTAALACVCVLHRCRYFVLADLGSLDPMYQFSLDAYTALFAQSLKASPRPQEGGLQTRIKALNEWHTFALYKYASRRCVLPGEEGGGCQGMQAHTPSPQKQRLLCRWLSRQSCHQPASFLSHCAASSSVTNCCSPCTCASASWQLRGRWQRTSGSSCCRAGR